MINTNNFIVYNGKRRHSGVTDLQNFTTKKYS